MSIRILIDNRNQIIDEVGEEQLLEDIAAANQVSGIFTQLDEVLHKFRFLEKYYDALMDSKTSIDDVFGDEKKIKSWVRKNHESDFEMRKMLYLTMGAVRDKIKEAETHKGKYNYSDRHVSFKDMIQFMKVERSGELKHYLTIEQDVEAAWKQTIRLANSFLSEEVAKSESKIYGQAMKSLLAEQAPIITRSEFESAERQMRYYHYFVRNYEDDELGYNPSESLEVRKNSLEAFSDKYPLLSDPSLKLTSSDELISPLDAAALKLISENKLESESRKTPEQELVNLAKKMYKNYILHYNKLVDK